MNKLTCRDCDAPYGEDGWCDVIIPNDVWNEIAPDDGVLCFRCMTKRIEAKGLTKVPVQITSGPYADDNNKWREIGFEQGTLLGLKPCTPEAACWILAIEEAIKDDDLTKAQYLLSREGSEDNKNWWAELELIAKSQ